MTLFLGLSRRVEAMHQRQSLGRSRTGWRELTDFLGLVAYASAQAATRCVAPDW